MFNITKNWAPATEEVYLVREINGKWLTILRNQHSMMIAELKRNWIGKWEVRDETGRVSSLASTYYPPAKEDEIVWSAAGAGEKEIAYYFGHIINPQIQKITVETKENIYEDVLIIKADGNRFFFKKAEGQVVMPVNIRGFSKSGELIFSTIKEN